MATSNTKQLTFAFGNNSKLFQVDATSFILKPKISTDVPFSEGKVLFTLRDSTIGDKTVIDQYKGGYIYFDYKTNDNKAYRLAMTSYFSDTAEKESTSNLPLGQAVYFDDMSQSEGDAVVRNDNNTSIYFRPFGNVDDGKTWIINYYPADNGWNWDVGSSTVTLSYLLKGVNRTINIPSFPLASLTTAGLMTAGDQTIGGNKTFDSEVTTFISERTDMAAKSDGNDAGLVCVGSALFGSNMRIDGTWLTINQTAKIECDSDKPCINFIFI